jgi:hypothetical protein
MFYLAYVPGINPDFSLSDKLLRRSRVGLGVQGSGLPRPTNNIRTVNSVEDK